MQTAFYDKRGIPLAAEDEKGCSDIFRQNS